MSAHFDPGVYSQIQSTLISSFSDLLASVTAYSQDLLFLCASIEIVLFALLWAVLGNNAFGRLLFTVLKIGFLLMVIREFDTWLGLILKSFAQIAQQTANATTAISLVDTPGTLWQYGYNSAMTLLKAAAADHISSGLSLMLTLLGLGILLVYGLLGARLIVTLAAFYLTALLALIFLPFGILKPTMDFAYRGLQSVLKSAASLFTLLLILTIATTVWQSNAMQLTDAYTINQILGIFFSGLVILLMAQCLPPIAASTIGEIKPWLDDSLFNQTSTPLATNTPMMAPTLDMRAATTLDPNQSSQLNGGHFSAAVLITPNASPNHGSLSPGAMTTNKDKSDHRGFNSATEVAPSISSVTLQKLKDTRHASGD